MSSAWGPSNLLVLMLTPINSNSMAGALLGYKSSDGNASAANTAAGEGSVCEAASMCILLAQANSLPVHRAAELWAWCVNQKSPSCF